MSSPHDDPTATRAIRLDVEVPGTPEEVWDAVATGPGITAWFVPAEVAEHLGGEVTLHFGPGMDEIAHVTVWEPPRRVKYETVQHVPELGEMRMGFEYLVEPCGAGTCLVRLVNSGFLSGAEWDGQYNGMEAGWRLFLSNLRLYRTHFPGQRCAPIIVNGMAAGPRDRAWAALLGALGIHSPVEGERVAATATDAPPLAGTVERVTDGMLTLRTDTPAPGIAFVAAEGDGEHVSTSFYGYFFGDTAPAVAARDESAWRSWMEATFPYPAPTPDAASSGD